jgi:proteasome lid subunit RPN8/RPN11
MSTSSDGKLQIPSRLYEEMLAQAVAELPNECCGILAGRDGRVTHRYALTNELANPVRYEADPRTIVVAFRHMRAQSTELLAIYHSHPTSEPVPSRTDLERNFYGSEVVHLIVSLQGGTPTVGAWHLDESTFRPAEWVIVTDDDAPVQAPPF